MRVKILIALATLIVAFLAIIALQPADFRIERSTTIAAPPAAVFRHVNDFHLWNAWSPWAKIDPAMQQTFAGAPTGTGAVYTWTGNKEVGEGRMTITESRPPDLVRITLEFLKPFAATNVTEFQFKAAEAQTTVTWVMTGTNNFMLKALGLFMNMDRMIGADFEKGLSQLKAVAEKA